MWPKIHGQTFQTEKYLTFRVFLLNPCAGAVQALAASKYLLGKYLFVLFFCLFRVLFYPNI